MIPRGFLSSSCRMALVWGMLAGGALAQPVPEIQITPPPEAASPAPAPAPGPAAVPALAPVPAQRDGTEPVAEAPDRQRFLGLRPTAPLPHAIVMGAGLSQPGVVRLTGEVAESGFSLLLPEGVPLPEELVLNVRSSIDVLPDTAALQVTVNDAPPVDLPLQNFDGFGALRVPAPDLKPGLNRIGILVRQPHRIFCGPDASFQLWTEIQLARSGAEYPLDALPPDARIFSLAVGNQIGAGQSLDLRVDQQIEPDTLRAVAGALGAAMQGQGQLNVQSFYAPASAGGAAVALIASDQSRVSYRQDAGGATVLQIETANGQLPDLAGAILPDALPAPHPAPMLPPGQTLTLADLGADDIVGNTHYFRHDLPFRLPADWLLLANQKAHLKLHYGFAADLPQGAMLLVKMNDETIRLLPLDRDGGKIMEPLAVPFAARLLHPGLNKLSFEMMVPGNPSDSACPLRRTDMLVVTRDTSIEVPSSPAMRLAGISTRLSGLTPAGIAVSPDAGDPRRMQVFAAQLAAGLAPGDSPDAEVRLDLVDIAGLPQSGSDLPVRVLQEALFPVAAAAAPATQTPAAPAEPRFRLSEEEASPAQEQVTAETQAPPRHSLGGWLSRQRERIENAAFMTSDDALSEWLQGRKGDALLMPGGPDQPGTLQLVLGPGAQIQTVAATLNTLRDAWLGEGRAVLISNDGTWQVWSSAELPRMEGPVTPLNLLPVLGNYASWSPFLFTVVLLGLGLISTIPALLVVVLFRKRRMR
ncbi:cellulose biosynthesis cyclic di-GMP-binding regulatory protein BcsB [Paracoccus sp. NGMCC 1.201697]|uniref:Cyclic di-GMP-binding protein n=1 Tax=Paracoccus broussonetiae subsp. drimophilus TaxID=3373869 RepID=A0ABW7LKA5_9RHOB